MFNHRRDWKDCIVLRHTSDFMGLTVLPRRVDFLMTAWSKTIFFSFIFHYQKLNSLFATAFSSLPAIQALYLLFSTCIWVWAFTPGWYHTMLKVNMLLCHLGCPPWCHRKKSLIKLFILHKNTHTKLLNLLLLFFWSSPHTISCFVFLSYSVF